MGRNIASLWILCEVGRIFSVFCDAHHLHARAIRHLVVAAQGAGYGAKDFACKFLVDDGHGRRVFVVTLGEVLPANMAVPAAWKYSGDIL